MKHEMMARTVGALAVAVGLLISGGAIADDSFADGFSLMMGTEEGGAYTDTTSRPADGVTHLLYEANQGTQNMRLQVVYHVSTVAAGANPQVYLAVDRATTGGGGGHDDYDVDFMVPGGAWTALGTIVGNNNPVEYWFAVPGGTDLSQGIDIRITDTISTPGDDGRLNQLELDAVAIETTGAPTPPDGDPSGLGAAAASSTRIDLSWTDGSTNEDGFRIERHSGGAFVEIATVGAGTTSFADLGLSPSTAYTYRVRAYNGQGDSGYSNEATDTTQAPPSPPDGAPSGMTATAAGSDAIDLSWLDGSTNEEAFAIERHAGGAFAEIAQVGAGVTTFSDTGLAASTTYTYRVRAVNGGGMSAWSNEAVATTDAAPAPSGKVHVGYYTSWSRYARDFLATEIPAEHVTHVQYAFAAVNDPESDGSSIFGDYFHPTLPPYTVVAGDAWADWGVEPSNPNDMNIQDLARLKEAHPDLRTTISVGGWSWSRVFTFAAFDTASRGVFADSLETYLTDDRNCSHEAATFGHPVFEGVDLDWEYPTGGQGGADIGKEWNYYHPDDPYTHALLIMAARHKLDALESHPKYVAAGVEHLELSIAAPGGGATADVVLRPLVDNAAIEAWYTANYGDVRDLEFYPGQKMDTDQDGSLTDEATALDCLDFVHIMAYDYAGGWAPEVRHHSPLYSYSDAPGDPNPDLEFSNVADGVALYQGMFDDAARPWIGAWAEHSHKFTMGYPTYGKAFAQVGETADYPAAEDGLFDSFPTDVVPALTTATLTDNRWSPPLQRDVVDTDAHHTDGTPYGTWEGLQGEFRHGIFDYQDLVQTAIDANNPIQRISSQSAPFLIRQGLGSAKGFKSRKTFVGFDDPQSLTEKVDFMWAQGMGGMMFWEFNGDLDEALEGPEPHQKSLIKTVHERMQALASP